MQASQVSIALTTCNGELYLPALLDSLARQTVLPCELVVCDDASTDSTVFLLENFASVSSFLVNIHINENRLRVVSNFSRALSLCRGDYVALCDQDDIWLPDKIVRCMQKMKEAERLFGADVPILVHTDLKLIDGDGNQLASSFVRLRRLRPEANSDLNKLIVQNVVTGCACLVNRPLLEAALPVPEKAILHDWWLALVAAARGKLVYEPEPTILYRRHGLNVMELNPFYSGSNLARLAGGEEMDRSVAAMIGQAAALQGRLDELPGEGRVLYLDHFLLAAEKGGLQGAAAALCFGIGKTGLVRNTAFIYWLLSGGYRKHLGQV